MTIPFWHDREREVLIYDTPTPLDIARVIPNSFEISGGYVGVPASLPNLQRMRSIAYPVIPPMEQRYDWPIVPGKAPWVTQRVVSNFLVLNPRAFCLSEMRTGKTLGSLWAADYVMKQEPAGTCRTLIVAPLKTLRRTWGEAVFQNFLGRRNYVVLHGSAAEREKLLDIPADFYIINPDGLGTGYGERGRKPELRGFAAKLMARQDIKIVIIDECSAYRTHTTRRWAVAKHLLGWRPYLWMMSGTPTPQGPLDAYGQARLLNNAYGESFTAYKHRVMQQISQFKWVPRQGASEEAKKLLSPAIRFTQEDCFEVGPVTIYQEDAELSDEQKKLLKEMKTQLQLTMSKGEKITAVNEGVLRTKLIQVACIGAGMRVLTKRRGWVEIENIMRHDLVWDGEDWVAHKGYVYKGVKETMLTGSVSTTPDHLIMSQSGWLPAEQISGQPSDRSYRKEVRLPEGIEPCRYDSRFPVSGRMAMPVRLRQRSGPRQSEPARQAPNESSPLRVQAWRASDNPRHVDDAPVQDMDAHAATLRKPRVQGLPKLRGKRYKGLQALAEVRELLGGHEEGLQTPPVDRPEEQRRELHPAQLQVGYRETATSKPAPQKSLVYDLVDCGPRNQFVVCGPAGDMAIVHNCGAIYDHEHNAHLIDNAPRIAVLKECVEEAPRKVIIFAPLTSVLHMLHKHFPKSAVLNGETSSRESDEILRRFQTTDEINPLIAHPGPIARGLDLTAAATIIWYAPTDKTEDYIQANERINGPAQKFKRTIVQIAATAIEREIYKRLEANETMQGVVLKLAEIR